MKKANNSDDPFRGSGDFGAYLNRIQWLIRKGDKAAAEKLFDIAWNAVCMLADSVEDRPEMFRWFAEELSVWPGIIGPNQAPPSLNLGEKHQLNLVGKKCASVEAKIATSFFWRIHGFRNLKRKFCSGQAYESSLAKKARQLQPLNRNNYKQWFSVAEKELMPSELGKAFEDNPMFKHYWDGDAYKELLPDNPREKRLVRNARALIRRDIKKQIKQAFRSIAPKSSRGEKQARGSK
jgi:hypothetical protein